MQIAQANTIHLDIGFILVSILLFTKNYRYVDVDPHSLATCLSSLNDQESGTFDPVGDTLMYPCIS